MTITKYNKSFPRFLDQISLCFKTKKNVQFPKMKIVHPVDEKHLSWGTLRGHGVP